MKPIIGVPLRYCYSENHDPILYIGERVRRTIQKAGGTINIIPPVQDLNYRETKGDEFPILTEEEKKIIHHYIDQCDGLFIPGGMKFTPYDRYVLEYAIKKKIPTLAVCLGMQIMTCYKEDVQLEKNETTINHNQKDYNELRHKVKIDKNSKLYQILNQEEIMVNSFHNMHGIENHIYKTVAKAEDGVIEAIEYPDDFFHIGVQWHPEISYTFDENSKLIIDYFLHEALCYQKEKQQLQTT